MYVSEKMTVSPIYVKADLPVSKAYSLMTETRHSSLPVVDDNNKPIGVITTKIIAQVNPSKATTLSLYEINHLLSKTKVRDIMFTGAFSISSDALIEDAALMMKENRIKALPVVGEDGCLCGIITRLDVFRAFVDILGLKTRGTHIVIKSDNKDDFNKVSSVIHKDNIKIRNINLCNKADYSELIIKLDCLECDKLINELKAEGFEIISVKKYH
jgi:acetoin utilization protein AcuB